MLRYSGAGRKKPRLSIYQYGTFYYHTTYRLKQFLDDGDRIRISRSWFSRLARIYVNLDREGGPFNDDSRLAHFSNETVLGRQEKRIMFAPNCTVLISTSNWRHSTLPWSAFHGTYRCALGKPLLAPHSVVWSMEPIWNATSGMRIAANCSLERPSCLLKTLLDSPLQWEK